jgi:hypothetical protein
MSLCVLAIVPAFGQVGYPPTKSPYVDIGTSQELSLIGGYFSPRQDPADVAPRGGVLTGLHYEWRASGPAHLTAEVARIASTRRLINPAKNPPARELGTVDQPLWSADFGLAMSLTGARTWHSLAPVLKVGAGFISNFHNAADTGGFKFGTRFALTWGGGVRWIPNGHSAFQIRADITNRLYTIGYPDPYYVAPTGGTAVVSAGQAKSFWTNNPAFTLGISRLF